MASVTFGQSQCLKSQPVGLGRTAVALRSGPPQRPVWPAHRAGGLGLAAGVGTRCGHPDSQWCPSSHWDTRFLCEEWKKSSSLPFSPQQLLTDPSVPSRSPLA